MPAWMPQWFIDGVLLLTLGGLFLGLYSLANRMLSNELHHLVSIIKKEWEDSKRRKFSVGSMNWRGFIALLLFGFVAIVFTSGQKLIGLIASFIGIDAARELISSTNFVSMFFFLASWLLISVIAVVVDERGRPRSK